MAKQMVMLYGLCGHPDQFQPQQNYFATNATVSVPDWFALCNRQAVDGNVIAYIARTLIQHLQQQRFSKPVLIGHSMGGVIALIMVSKLGYPVERLVILDSSLTPTPEKKAAYGAWMQELLDAPDQTAYIKQLFHQYFFAPMDDPLIANRLVNQAALRPNIFWFEALASVVQYNFEALLHQLTVPALYIGSDRPFADMPQLKAINPLIQTARVQGSGHFLTVFAPQKVNALVQTFCGE